MQVLANGTKGSLEQCQVNGKGKQFQHFKQRIKRHDHSSIETQCCKDQRDVNEHVSSKGPIQLVDTPEKILKLSFVF